MFIVGYGCSWGGPKHSCIDIIEHRHCNDCKYTFYNPWHKNPEYIYNSKEELIKHLESLHFFPEINGMTNDEYALRYHYYGRDYKNDTLNQDIYNSVIQEKENYIKNFTDSMQLNNLYHSDALRLNDGCCDIIIYYTNTLSKPIFLSHNDIYK